MKLDYIRYDGSFDTRIEKFKLGTDLDQSKINFHSSLDYNHNDLGLTQFFANGPIDSPKVNGAAPTGVPIDYSFDSPAQLWLPEIGYEFEIQKNAIPGFTFTADAFIDDLLLATYTDNHGNTKNATTFHMSPNKLGGNKVYPVSVTPVPEASVTPVPEASSILVWSLLGIIGAAIGCVRTARRDAPLPKMS